jgi:GntR family transcriptional regulator
MQVDKAESEAARPPGPAVVFRLDPVSGVPTYLQLVHQVEHAVRLGYLQPGDQLPKVREVVADLAINPNTVLKAYRELEHKGLAAGRPGVGTFVQATVPPVMLPGLTQLRRSLREWLDDSAAAGLDEQGAIALFNATLRDFRERRDGSSVRPARTSRRAGGGVA